METSEVSTLRSGARGSASSRRVGRKSECQRPMESARLALDPGGAEAKARLCAAKNRQIPLNGRRLRTPLSQ